MMTALQSNALFSDRNLFCQGVQAGELTFLAADARGPDGSVATAGSIRDQTAKTLSNLATGLDALGQEPGDIVSLWVLLPSYEEIGAVAAVIQETFSQSRKPYPATTFLGIVGLEAGCRVRMDAVATTVPDRQQIVAPGVPLAEGSRSHGVRVGGFCFLSGVDAAGGRTAGEHTIETQTLEILNRLDAVLKTQNLSLRNLCRTFMFLKGSEYRPGYGTARKQRYQGVFAEAEFPPNSGIMVKDLGRDILLRSVAIASREQWQLVTSPRVRLSPGSFSQSFRVGHWLFIAGMDAIGFNREIRCADDLAGQTEESLEYLGCILEAAGASWHDLVKTTVYLAAGQDRSIFESAWARFFRRREIAERPAGLTFEVKELAPRILVEIDGVALLASVC